MAALIVIAWFVVASILKFNQDREYARSNALTPFWKGFFVNLMVVIPGFEVLKLLGFPQGSLVNLFIMVGYMILVNIVARSFGIQDRGSNPPDSQDPPADGGNGS